MTGNTKPRSRIRKVLPCVWMLIMGLAGSYAQAEDEAAETVRQLQDDTRASLKRDLGNRPVNFVLNFVQDPLAVASGGKAIVPAGAEKPLTETTEPPNLQGKPTRLILFVNENDKICIQKPDGSWKCYTS